MSELHVLPGHLIRRLQQIQAALFSARMAEAGLDLTSVQYAAMVILDEKPGIDQATLAGLIGYDRVTIGGVLDRLVQKGILQREINPTDRRARILRLSPAGREVLKSAKPWVDLVQTDITDSLTDSERRTFLTLLQKITKAENDRSRAPLRQP